MIKQLETEHRARLLAKQPDVSRAWQYNFTAQDVELRMQAFRRNLESIIQIYQSRNIPIILGTIPSNLCSPLLPERSVPLYEPVEKLIEENRFDAAYTLARQVLKETSNRHQSSDLENEIIRDISRKYTVSLVDVERVIADAEPHHIPGETLFSDHCHLNAVGNRILADAYLSEMLTSTFLARLQ